MNKLRNQYLYKLQGQIHSQQLKKALPHPQHFYQLNIICENLPQVQKVFVFKSKATPEIWQAIEQANCGGQKYLFYCRNYRGYYHVVDWKPLGNQKKTEPEPSTNSCQAQYPLCQQVATYQHILKLGSVSIDKQWVCGNCKQELEKK